MSCSVPEWQVVRKGTSGAVPIVLGECPVWSASERVLYSVDIDGRRIHRLDVSSGAEVVVQLEWPVGALGLVASLKGVTWLASSAGLHLFDWASLRSTLVSGFPDARDCRFNDGKVGPGGDLFVGSMVAQSDLKLRQGRGHLFRIAAAEQGQTGVGALNRVECATVQIAGTTLSNGMDFVSTSPTATPAAGGASSALYWIDSALKRVECLDMVGTASAVAATSDKAASSVSVGNGGGGVQLLAHRRVAFDCTQFRDPRSHNNALIKGDPDGMAIDVEGCIWIVMAGGGRVVRVSPQGVLLRVVDLPVSKVTSLCFGGEGMDELFVTSASKGVDLSREPLAGSTFRIRKLGVKGREMNKLRGNFCVDDRAPTQIIQHKARQEKHQQPHQSIVKSKL